MIVLIGYFSSLVIFSEASAEGWSCNQLGNDSWGVNNFLEVSGSGGQSWSIEAEEFIACEHAAEIYFLLIHIAHIHESTLKNFHNLMRLNIISRRVLGSDMLSLRSSGTWMTSGFLH